MSAVLPALRQRLARWFHPAPDSFAAQSLRMGKSPWVDAVHLLWTVWVFITPIFSDRGWDGRWWLCTALSYPLFLFMYAKSVVAPRRQARLWGEAMALLSLAMLRWYPSGLTYFVFGCVMLRGCAAMSPRRYVAIIAALNAAMLLEAWLLGYAWQAVISIPLTTFIIGMIVHAERTNEEATARLRLSHEEVRRLATIAERERIGRDLHDLLGHTLSLITLKLELSRKLFDRDAEAARREVEEAERVARHALAEVRAAVTGIRATDLAAELASSRLLLAATGVHLDYAPPPADLPVETGRALALVLREAATNIARHAQAGHARIMWEQQGDRLRLGISDDGRGGVHGEGNGLAGMRERVRALGGTLTIDSPRGRGTRIEVRVPARAASASALVAEDTSTSVSTTTLREHAA